MGFRPRRFSAALTAAVVLTGAGGVLAATPAAAGVPAPVPITCGAVLHQNAYLPADLTCPTGNGVTVAASLSIDLQGHHLTGSTSGVGITVEYPASLKVTHGRLTGWGKGLTSVSPVDDPVTAPSTITVIAVTFLHNGIGIAPGEVPTDGSAVLTYSVYRSWFVSNDIGVGGLVGEVQVNVSGATFRTNRAAVSVAGDQYDFTGGVKLSSSEVTDSKIGVYCSFMSCELYNNGFSGNATGVQTNDFFVYLAASGNTFTGSTTAVDLHANYIDDLAGNTFTGNKTAVSFDSGGGSVRDNVFSGNGTALTMIDAGGNGDTSLYSPLPVSGNRVSNNTGDGIVISGGEVQLKDNISTFNHGWGIEAPGEVDQGGNKAFGNYHSPQCVGVVCTH